MNSIGTDSWVEGTHAFEHLQGLLPKLGLGAHVQQRSESRCLRLEGSRAQDMRNLPCACGRHPQLLGPVLVLVRPGAIEATYTLAWDPTSISRTKPSTPAKTTYAASVVVWERSGDFPQHLAVRM